MYVLAGTGNIALDCRNWDILGLSRSCAIAQPAGAVLECMFCGLCALCEVLGRSPSTIPVEARCVATGAAGNFRAYRRQTCIDTPFAQLTSQASRALASVEAAGGLPAWGTSMQTQTMETGKLRCGRSSGCVQMLAHLWVAFNRNLDTFLTTGHCCSEGNMLPCMWPAYMAARSSAGWRHALGNVTLTASGPDCSSSRGWRQRVAMARP